MLSKADSDGSTNIETKKRIAQPPLNLLFNPSLIDRQDVWQINIVKLLETLLELLNKTGNKDLRVCGVAILTSSLIHRLKVESIFRLDKIANQKNVEKDTEKETEKKIPIPELANLGLPFRKETTYPSSLEELLLVLENMITELSTPKIRRNILDLEPVESFDFQEYLINFEKIIEEYEITLFDKINFEKEIIFNIFVQNMSALEIARYFIAMLYLAMNGKIEISFQYSMNNNNHNNNNVNNLGNLNTDKSNRLYEESNFDFIKISVINN